MPAEAQPAFALIADLDGTLIDSIPSLFRCYRHTLEPHLKILPSDAELYPRFGKPNAQTLAQYVQGAALDDAIARYRIFYSAQLANITLFAGVERLLDAVRVKGWAMAIVTGKSRGFTEQTLANLGILERIDVLVSGDEVKTPKPDPEGIQFVLQRLALSPECAIYVGDSPDDIRAGRRAGVFTGAAFWAAFAPKRLDAAGADFRFERLDDLVRWVETATPQSLDSRVQRRGPH